MPVLVLLELLLLEPDRTRRRWTVLLVVLGTAVGARLLWILLTDPVGGRVAG